MVRKLTKLEATFGAAAVVTGASAAMAQTATTPNPPTQTDDLRIIEQVLRPEVYDQGTKFEPGCHRVMSGRTMEVEVFGVDAKGVFISKGKINIQPSEIVCDKDKPQPKP